MIFRWQNENLVQGRDRTGAMDWRPRSKRAETPMNDTNADRWLSVEEIANHLGVKRDTVYKWIDRKRMPAHKVGRLWKFRRDEIDEWVRSGGADDRERDSDS